MQRVTHLSCSSTRALLLRDILLELAPETERTARNGTWVTGQRRGGPAAGGQVKQHQRRLPWWLAPADALRKREGARPSFYCPLATLTRAPLLSALRRFSPTPECSDGQKGNRPFLQSEEGCSSVMPVVSGSPWAPPQASEYRPA